MGYPALPETTAMIVPIEIVSDFVCPWCFIGTRRLKIAVAQVHQELPDLEVQPRWRPFFLNPDTPPEGEPYLPFLESKFGGRAPLEAIFERVRAAGRPYGVEYSFEKIRLSANTLLAHRLVHWAQEQAPADALIDRIYVGQFQRGEHIGDLAVLVAIAAECGYDAPDVAAYLVSDRDTTIVVEQARKVQAMGINIVPTFMLPGNRIIVGAEDPSVLATGIRETLEGDRPQGQRHNA
jgi:predicted DsbA family dithiol-disulfide isomerase